MTVCDRFANTFYNWQSYITITDDTVTKEMEDQLYKVLSQDAAISMFRMPKRSLSYY